MQIRVDLQKLVNEAADEFEIAKQVQVTSDARTALVEPALPHSEKVQQELSEGRITMEFLKSCVSQVLNTARKFIPAERPKVIDRPEVELSMKHYCPYVQNRRALRS